MLKLDQWTKSNRSSATNCVEAALQTGDWIAVRDTKDDGNGPALYFTRDEWTAFLGGVEDGDFDLP